MVARKPSLKAICKGMDSLKKNTLEMLMIMSRASLFLQCLSLIKEVILDEKHNIRSANSNRDGFLAAMILGFRNLSISYQHMGKTLLYRS